jgi:hypothetical protein
MHFMSVAFKVGIHQTSLSSYSVGVLDRRRPHQEEDEEEKKARRELEAHVESNDNGTQGSVDTGSFAIINEISSDM